MKSETKLNKPLIRKIREHVLEEPRRYKQSTWFCNYVSKHVSPCGTQGCIGGWAEHLSGQNAQTALGLNDAAFNNLCGYGNEWPEPYRSEFKKASTYDARANVAGRLLSAVIRTNGKILEL